MVDTTLATFASDGDSAIDQLFAGPADHIRAENIVLITGQVLTRGALLGKITASGKYTLSLSASSDGSQTPDAILAHDCDATGADKQTVAYKGGWFNETRVVYGTGHTAASVREGLRDKNIQLIKVQPA